MAKNKRKKNKAVEQQDIFVSTVVVAKADTEKLTNYIVELADTLAIRYTNYEIIIVDNGVDDSEVSQLADTLLNIPCIRIIRLAQRFKHDTALFAGLQVSIGDFVCTLDPTLDPVGAVPQLVAKNQTKDVVQGVSDLSTNGSWIGLMGRKLFYWYNRKYIGIDVPANATFLASYSRKAVNALTQSTRSQYHIRHLARRVGYAYVLFPYMPTQNPRSDRKLKHGIIEALEISISYSVHPLRFVTGLGVLASLINGIYAIYVVLLNVFDQQIAEGWTTTSLQLSLMFFILFIAIVIIAEYIGRILTESYKDPQYYVTDELTSTVSLANAEKRNVTK